jgi:hypothetical protein
MAGVSVESFIFLLCLVTVDNNAFKSEPLQIAKCCAPAPDLFCRRTGNGKPTARTCPAALELRVGVSGKPKKSTTKADPLLQNHSVRGTMRLSVDYNYLAPDAQQYV